MSLSFTKNKRLNNELPKSTFKSKFDIIRKKAAIIHVLVASLKITAIVKLTTEKNTIDSAPIINAHINRLNASSDSKKLSVSRYTIRSPLPKMA